MSQDKAEFAEFLAASWEPCLRAVAASSGNMTLATVVVEAGERSGARAQAPMAVEHGRQVILTDQVLVRNEWAQALLGRPGVHVASSVDRVLETVEQVAAMWDELRRLVTPDMADPELAPRPDLILVAVGGRMAARRAEREVSSRLWRSPVAELAGHAGLHLKNCGLPAIIDVMATEEPYRDVSMLLAFRAANVRSFRDELELSMLATALAEKDVPQSVPWREGGRPIQVLPAAGIFGANASGKSNLLRVMADMRAHVLHSFRHGDPAGGMPRSAFRLDPARESTPSRFEVDLVLNGIRYEYGFEIDDDRVLTEWAYRYPRGKAALLFRREGDAVTLGERNRAKGRAVIEILRPNSLVLSAAAAANHPDLLPLRQWFGQNLLLAEASSRAYRWAFTADLLRKEQRRDQVLGLLNAADLGITDARVRELDPQLLERLRQATRILEGREEEPDGRDSDPDIEPPMVLSHRGVGGDVEFEPAEESLGTMVWLGLAGPVIDALAHGNVLLVDEIEASLHPALASQLVKLFQDAESNPRGAQLIFNSHEASLLGDAGGERVLGRDQVWFTEKSHDGATRLYPLADLSPRSDEAIGRRYLAGRYGAAPILAREEFAEVALSAVGERE